MKSETSPSSGWLQLTFPNAKHSPKEATTVGREVRDEKGASVRDEDEKGNEGGTQSGRNHITP